MMKSTVIDVLLYLFEHYLDDEFDLDSDQDLLKAQMRDAGFDPVAVSKAFAWLDDLAAVSGGDGIAPAMVQSTRVYAPEEQRKLDVECRGFLYFLEQTGAIDARSRETIIDRVMALEVDGVDLEQLKWIILMVLFNQPGQDQSFNWMEELVMDELGGALH